MGDILQVQGIQGKGYGIIPKLVMQDKQLTIYAKAIYSYLCSFAGAGQTAFPPRNKILYDLGISKDSYYKHLNLLKECGYLRAEQMKNSAGQFKRNLYTLVEVVPRPAEKDMDENRQSHAFEPYKETLCPAEKDTAVHLSAQCPDSQCPVEPGPVGKDTNNNSIKINNLKNNSQSSPSEERQDGLDPTDVPRKIGDTILLVKENIGYESLTVSHRLDLPLVDEVVAIMVDVLVSEGPYIILGGENKPRELVKRNLLLLDYDCIVHVLEQFKSQPNRIAKKRQYILTMLYNCKMELDAHYTNWARSEGGKEFDHV